MAKLPLPPSVAKLRAIAPVVATEPAGSSWFRIHRRGGDHPTDWNELRDFGPLDGRFDHHLRGADGKPQVQDRGILYLAKDGPTCLAEVFQRFRLIDRTHRDPWLVSFALARQIRLLDLTSAWPTQAGASQAINSGPRKRVRRWARAIYEAYPDLDGVLYASSMNANVPMVALWERGLDALPVGPLLYRALDDPVLETMMKNAAVRFGYRLD